MPSPAKGTPSPPTDDTGCGRIYIPAQVQQRVGKEEEKLKRERTSLTGGIKFRASPGQRQKIRLSSLVPLLLQTTYQINSPINLSCSSLKVMFYLYHVRLPYSKDQNLFLCYSLRLFIATMPALGFCINTILSPTQLWSFLMYLQTVSILSLTLHQAQVNRQSQTVKETRNLFSSGLSMQRQ